MIFPEGIENWTSENEGADYLEFVYLPSDESEIFFDEANI